MKLTNVQKLGITRAHQEVRKIIGATVCGECGFMLVPTRFPKSWEEVAYARAAHVEELIAVLEEE